MNIQPVLHYGKSRIKVKYGCIEGFIRGIVMYSASLVQQTLTNETLNIYYNKTKLVLVLKTTKGGWCAYAKARGSKPLIPQTPK